MELTELLGSEVKLVLKELLNISPAEVQLQKTKPEFEGDWTLVVFPYVKLAKKSPEETGNLIGEKLLNSSDLVRSFNVIKGFLNLEIEHASWIQELNRINAIKNFGCATSPSGKTFMVEYASPNTNKPLHLGHLRNIFLGFSVSQILKANGHEVLKTQIINDRGIHICKSMVAWKRFGNGENPQSSNTKGDHLVGKYYVRFDQEYKKEIAEIVASGKSEDDAKNEAPIFVEAQAMLQKWEAGDDEVVKLWKTMNEWVYAGFDKTYKKMGVDFDSVYYESDTYILGKQVVEEGLNAGHFYQKDDGSIWTDLTKYKMDDKLLLRADGTSVYITQDIGTAIERTKNHPELSSLIYTVGNEQNHHFKVLFSILDKLGYDWASECYHLSYGMVDLPSGRMKSREGTVVDADDIMDSIVADAKSSTQERGHIKGMSDQQKNELFDQIGLGALKYYLLKVDPKKNMLFNPEESIDLNGNTGPFVQYCYARTRSILAKSEMNTDVKISDDYVLNDSEMSVLKLLLQFSCVVQEAGNNYSPAIICNYIYDLARSYNSFFQFNPILKQVDEETKKFRVILTKQVGDALQLGAGLLGVVLPNRM